MFMCSDSVGNRKITMRSEKVMDGGSNYYVERFKGKKQTLYKVFFHQHTAIDFYIGRLGLMQRYHAREKRNAGRAGTKIR